jgi:uncharacterized protein
LNHGVDIHVDNDYALRLATKHGHETLFKYLIKKGANVKAYNNQVLSLASETGNIEMVKYLINKGVNVDIHAIRAASVRGHATVFKYLIKRAVIEKTFNNQVLYLASGTENIEMVKYLIDKGANIDFSSMWKASLYGHSEVVKYLIELATEMIKYPKILSIKN